LTKILHGNAPSTSSKEEITELEEKAQSAIVLSVSDGVLRKVVNE
jgi:hypothetical protein